MNMYTHFFHWGLVPPMSGIAGIFLTLLFVLLALWTLVWKGLALWSAARNDQKPWFVALLILNTLGILEIIYLVWFRKSKNPTTPSLFEASDTAASASSAPAAE